MKSVKVITVLCVSLLTLVSCNNPLSGSLDEQLKDEKFELGKEFKIGFDKTFTDSEKSIQIKFTDVKSEERCAADVTCVWAGNAKIGVKVISSSHSGNIELNTHENLTTSGDFKGYEVRLVKLDPYPQSSQNPIPERQYVATLVVERNN